MNCQYKQQLQRTDEDSLARVKEQSALPQGKRSVVHSAGKLSPYDTLYDPRIQSNLAMVPVKETEGLGIQPKLKVGSAGDRYEQEADRVAEMIIKAPNNQVESKALEPPNIKKKLPMDYLQAKTSSFSEPTAISKKLELDIKSSTGGKPLPTKVGNDMAIRFGTDFSGVRIYSGSKASAINQQIRARAFTQGANIFMGENPNGFESRASKQILAHELTHTIQQGAVPRAKNIGIQQGLDLRQHIQRYQNYDAKDVKPKHNGVVVIFGKEETKPNAFSRKVEGEDATFYPRTDLWNGELRGRLYEKVDTEAAKQKEREATNQPEYKRKRALDTEFRNRTNKIYEKPKEGTFEYVAEYLYASISAETEKRKIFDELYKVTEGVGGNYLVQEAVLTNEAKKNLLRNMMRLALKKFDPSLPAKELVEKAGDQIKPTLMEKELPSAVAIGFHGTDGSPYRQVTRSREQGGWGGLQKPMTVPLFKARYGLDKTEWNPLAEELNKGPHYRQGKNQDNELLSTVSIATRANAAIKFPFPKEGKNEAETWLYAVVVKKAYPTFKIQRSVFPEVAVDGIPPEDIIGYQHVLKLYGSQQINALNKSHELGINPAEIEERSMEQFSYWTGRFRTNRLFRQEYEAAAGQIANSAARALEEDVGHDRWGIYNNRQIKKGKRKR